jgi:hypothetical protein
MTFAPDLSGTRLGPDAGRLPMDQPMPKGAKRKEQLPEEMLAMRDYALGESGMSRSDGTVLLHVSHSNLKNTFFHELRLDMHSTIEAIKRKLEFHTGTSAVTNQVRPCPARCARLRPAGIAAAAAAFAVVGQRWAWLNKAPRLRGSCTSSTRTRR